MLKFMTTSMASTTGIDAAPSTVETKSYAYLKDFYEKTTTDPDGKNITFLCKLCPPNLKKQVRTSTTSVTNLKRHVELKHPMSLGQYLRVIDEHKKLFKTVKHSFSSQQLQRSFSSQQLPRSATELKFVEFCKSPVTFISQQQVDSLVLDYIVGDLQPLSKVGNPAFVKLVTGLQPSRRVPSRRLAQTLLNKAIKDNIFELKTKLSEVDIICTTADCWSAANKAYVGVTIHWLNQNDISQRSSAVLACRCIKGTRTYDVLAKTLSDVYEEFGIENKIVCTVTDNAANFVKEFSCFGEHAVEGPEPIVDNNKITEEEEDESKYTLLTAVAGESSDEDDGMEPLPLSALKDLRVPPHRRCMAHTLNLVAKDTEKLSEKNYKKMSSAVFAKASTLWNRIKRCPKASEFVEETLGISFVLPNDTQWNSVFLAMQRLSLITTLTADGDSDGTDDVAIPLYDKLLLHAVCDEFGFHRFSVEEINFINVFVDVMRPLASALNIFQSEKNIFLGYLVPTIVQLENDLNGLLNECTKPTASQGLLTCRPLIQIIMESLKTRLGSLLEDKENILAAMLLPRFKLDWVEDEVKCLQYRGILKQEFQTVNYNDSETKNPDQYQPGNDLEMPDPAASFFRFKRNPQHIKKTEVDTFLDSPTTDGFAEYMLLPNLKKLFIRYNTTLPSSTSVERTFIIGGPMFKARRNRLGDANIEKQLILNANKKI